MQYLPDGKFYRNISLMLCDLFGYRVSMNNEQFFQEGYAERKLILILDVYDIVKRTKTELKLEYTLA
jgi:hypothetical protein